VEGGVTEVNVETPRSVPSVSVCHRTINQHDTDSDKVRVWLLWVCKELWHSGREPLLSTVCVAPVLEASRALSR
jgi:hypothetical protein